MPPPPGGQFPPPPPPPTSVPIHIAHPGGARPQASPSAVPAVAVPEAVRTDPWSCERCNFPNPPAKDICYSCTAPRPVPQPSSELAVSGLDSDVSHADIFASLKSMLDTKGADSSTILRRLRVEAPRNGPLLLRFSSVAIAEEVVETLGQATPLAGCLVSLAFYHRPKRVGATREKAWQAPVWNTPAELVRILEEIEAGWADAPQEARDFFNNNRASIAPGPPVTPPPAVVSDAAPKLSVAERLAAMKKKKDAAVSKPKPEAEAAVGDVGAGGIGNSPSTTAGPDAGPSPGATDFRARLAAKKAAKEREKAEADEGPLEPWPAFWRGSKEHPVRFKHHVQPDASLELFVPAGIFAACGGRAAGEEEGSTFGYSRFRD